MICLQCWHIITPTWCYEFTVKPGVRLAQYRIYFTEIHPPETATDSTKIWANPSSSNLQLESYEFSNAGGAK